MLGDTEKVLYGSGEIRDTLLGMKFTISARSFYQVNHVQTEKLYSKAIEFACLKGDERVLDCYCGIGTIGLIASRHCAEVLGVESNAAAIKDAKKNAKLNGVKNIGFVCADTGSLLSELCEQGERADVVMLDPARAGCDRKTLSSLLEMMPERIVYISCNPETQERDVKELVKGGYKVKRVQPVDMFPYTSHVETVVLLSREKADDHIRFSINTEDLKKNVGGYATYGDIKAYVLEKFGLKVSSLYIAQTKDKCGIKERENYYIGEGKSKELICPPEKEQAIMDAFRHFGMLRD